MAENDEPVQIISPLDLPQLYSRPSAEELFKILGQFSRASQQTNFSGPTPADEDDGTEGLCAAPGTGFFDWLTGLVASPLQWIDDSNLREEIWDQASTLMAERCGRTAAPTITRRIQIDGMREALIKLGKISDTEKNTDVDIQLIEPSLTEDLLGLKTWGSSYILARRLVRDALLPQSKLKLAGPALELGTGTGLVGLVAARLGLPVTLTDLPEIMPNLRANIDQNMLSGIILSPTDPSFSPPAQPLDWSDPSEFLQTHKPQSFKTVLVSDPIYSPQHPAMVVRTIAAFLSREPGSKLVLQLPLRRGFDDLRTDLYGLLVKAGLCRIEYEEEEGYDDFGAGKFAYSLWEWADAHEKQ
ncbi:uncharacterized protein SAPINGB_P002425 [Magnusiomyces paraingens]|uniref:Uncharacterized protein n=1 Tax=Magnusiomyces paraingens TaxID=2606893 RepID=A0A5E8BFX8_9ASCO|nr:uncharacterized protein SAPINGB_P002425 [Saprochaete ingens]VVT49751.1 unnamed protein product [Saprochaete ingens]